MAYIPKNKGIYVVLAAQLYDNGIYYHCTGSAVSLENAIRYAESYENHYRQNGWELDEVRDDLDRADYYESTWINKHGNQAFLKIQKSALMQ